MKSGSVSFVVGERKIRVEAECAREKSVVGGEVAGR